MTIATTVEQAAAQEAVRAFARTHNVLQGARDETGAAWRPVWSSLAELGMFGVAVAEEAGGAGGTLADLAAMLEQAGYELIPGPVVTTSIGALLCSAAQVPPPLVDAIVTGRQPVAISAPQADAVIRIGTDGCRYLTGTFPSVHGAGTESLMILSAHHNAEALWVLVDPDQHGVEVTALPGIDFAAPMGRVVCCDVSVIGEISCAQGSVEDLHMTGVVAVCSGIARRCLDIAASYANLREQFGDKIGAGVLAWDAATVEADDRPLAAAAAGAVTLDAAVDNAKDCIQILGATGFTWEHDAHLYLRRAVTCATMPAEAAAGASAPLSGPAPAAVVSCRSILARPSANGNGCARTWRPSPPSLRRISNAHLLIRAISRRTGLFLTDREPRQPDSC